MLVDTQGIGSLVAVLEPARGLAHPSGLVLRRTEATTPESPVRRGGTGLSEDVVDYSMSSNTPKIGM
ncbi:hypothetical protein ACFQL5_11875 [Aquipuribacter hungaricus]